MKPRLCLLLFVLGIGLVLPLAAAEQFPYVLLDDTTNAGDEYSVYYELAPAANWSRLTGARVAFDYQDAGNHRYATFSLGRVALMEVTGGQSKELAVSDQFQPKGAVKATIQRRTDGVRVVADGMMLLTARLPAPPGGKVGAGSPGGHIRCQEGLLQPIGPVYFTDDFTRGAQEMAQWQTPSGVWENTEVKAPGADPVRSANPFSLRCNAPQGGLATAGYWFWDVYRAQVSVKPIAAEAVGLCAYVQDATNYLLFRWKAGEAQAAAAKQLVLVRNGRERVLAEAPGGFAPGQWYRLAVEVGEGVAACSIDRDPVLRADTNAFGQGAVGLWTQGEAVTFDDVQVISPQLRPAALHVTDIFLQDAIMNAQGLYNPEGAWYSPGANRTGGLGAYWHRGVFYGDCSVRVPAAVAQAGSLSLILRGTEPDEKSGYLVSLQPEGNLIKVAVQRGDQTVGQGQGQVGAEGQVEAAWRKGRLSVAIDGNEVCSVAEPQPPTGRRIAVMGAGLGAMALPTAGGYVIPVPPAPPINPGVPDTALQRTAPGEPPAPAKEGGRAIFRGWGRFVVAPGGGFTTALGRLEVTGDNWLDYTFADAPTDWYATKGDWYVTTRWPCEPGWTFLGGVHYENPVTWTKHVYEGDVIFEARANIQMDLPRSPGYSDPSDVDLALCGDGLNLDSGYAFIYAGWGNRKSAILRKGQVVAQNTSAVFIEPTSHNEAFHRHWFRLRAEKLGNRIRFLCDDQLVCEYTDPDPLPGGRAAMWSAGNNLMVARAQLWYESEKPAPLPSLPDAPPPVEPVQRPDRTAIADSFERDMGEWHTLAKPIAVRLDLDDSTASAGKRSLRITNLRPGGPMVAYALVGGFRASDWPHLSFDYRMPPEVKVDVYLYLGDAWHAVRLTGNTPDSGSVRVLGDFPDVRADGQWHHAEFDLLPPLQRLYPQRQTFQVDYLAFASPDERYLRCGIGGNPMAAAYWLDEFRLTP